ncbi:helix-turn-helix domain-containing protein [Pseudomonas sp. RA_15y_Pfl2_54]|uniref:helix-turn-helix domain-containing protein n=1 Tax=Pseudomonas sp. RA_15y_Pfl2_54 TaxID=3088704 RepID=UPI0030DA1B5D
MPITSLINIRRWNMSPQSETTPSTLTHLLPSSPLLCVGGAGHGRATVQLFRNSPAPERVTVSPLRDHLLIVVLSGHVLVEEDQANGAGARRWAGSGQMSLIPAGTETTRRFKGSSEVLLVHLPQHLVRQTARESGLLDSHAALMPRLAVADEVVERLGRLLLAAAYDSETGTELMLDALTKALIIHLLQNHSSQSPEKEIVQPALSKGRLQCVINHMQTHMDEPLPLSSLADLSGLSPSQFARTFRAVVGKPPHGYLLDLRIDRARNLLENTDLPVIEVGMQCGFEQPNHFATMFKKINGLSPRAWRIARRLN